MKFPTWKFAQRVLLAQPLTYARPASSTRSATSPGLEFPNLEIRLASLRIYVMLQISVLYNYTNQLICPASKICTILQKLI